MPATMCAFFVIGRPSPPVKTSGFEGRGPFSCDGLSRCLIDCQDVQHQLSRPAASRSLPVLLASLVRVSRVAAERLVSCICPLGGARIWFAQYPVLVPGVVRTCFFFVPLVLLCGRCSMELVAVVLRSVRTCNFRRLPGERSECCLARIPSFSHQ